jgi:hypothetical protein
MLISDLQLTITPSASLYTAPVPDSSLAVNESATSGRHAIILDFNDPDGLYVRDLGCIFQWPTVAKTVLDIFQPSIIPLDDDLHYRLSYHFLIKSLNGVGWNHVRELNVAFNSTTDLTVLFTFDDGAVPQSITLTVPNSGGEYAKTKITLPPNKWKLIEGFISSPEPFLLWDSDLELKTKSWGSHQGYKIERPFSG